MQSGEDQNVITGHALYSVEGLRRTSRDDLADLYGQRHLFEGFERVRVTSFERVPSDDPLAPEMAVARALVFYDTDPPAQIDARLDADASGWRIRTIHIARGEP
jgi:hypothetical protein